MAGQTALEAPTTAPDWRRTTRSDRPRGRRMLAPALTLASLGAATAALGLRDPHVDGSWGHCPLAAMGVWCPGCGGLRAVNDLLHGQVVAAASSNLLLVALAPLVVAWLALWTRDRWRGIDRYYPDRWVLWGGVAFAAASVVFMVLRNVPAGQWLAP